jgi:hypothetical protein
MIVQHTDPPGSPRILAYNSAKLFGTSGREAPPFSSLHLTLLWASWQTDRPILVDSCSGPSLVFTFAHHDDTHLPDN